MTSGYVPDVITEAVGSEPTYQMAVEEVAFLPLELDIQHLLPASFHQQEGGALMVLIQSKKMKLLFSNLVLGLLQGADS